MPSNTVLHEEENSFEPSIMIPETRKILSADFYLRPTLEVAKDLLGKIFVRKQSGLELAGKIVEVEAYHQDGDEASHSYKGRTARNALMFDAGGRLYVYFIYGMHFCMNVTTEKDGIGAAVLIRGIEPVHGIEDMRKRRGPDISFLQLTNGPAKCCQAFGIGRSHNGASLCGPEICILEAPSVIDADIGVSSRIGITSGRKLEWRFFVKGNPFVSGFRKR
jgi:DNA-3-methyladenine glycosylase